MVNAGSFLAVITAIIFYHNDRTKSAEQLKATLEILEQRIQQDDKKAALAIVDRSIRSVGSHVSSGTTGQLLDFALKLSEPKPSPAPPTAAPSSAATLETP